MHTIDPVEQTWSSRLVSIWEVASSMITILLRRRSARAIATSCLSPALREPVWLMGMSRLTFESESCWVLDFRMVVRWHRSRTSQHSLSVCSSKGSKFERMVPVNRDTSWLMIVYRIHVNFCPTRSKGQHAAYYSSSQIIETQCTDIDTVNSGNVASE